MDSARIVAVCPPASFGGSMPSYRLFIDDVEVGKLRGGDEAVFDVDPGLHSVRATLDGWISNTVPVQSSPGGELTSKLSPNGESGRDQIRSARRSGHELRLTPSREALTR